MPACPKCATKATKAMKPHKHYHCKLHGFLRWIGDVPEGYKFGSPKEIDSNKDIS